MKQIEYGGGLINVTLGEPTRIGSRGDTLDAAKESSSIGFATTAGFNFPIYHPEVGSAIGIAPSLEGAISLAMFSEGGADYVSGAIPILLTYKRGGDAEYHNQKGWGMTAGLGAVFGLYVPGSVGFTSNSDKLPFVTYTAPVGMVEVNYAKRDAIVKLRFQSMFMASEDAEKGYSYMQSGLYLVFSSGFLGGESTSPR